MNILFIGDIIGRSGRATIKKVLPDLIKSKKIDLVIANGENLAGGTGMTIETYQEMLEVGIDYFTSGNHIWRKSDFIAYLDDKKIKVLRPLNYPEGVPGRGFANIKVKGINITIINLLGATFMDEYIENPFHIIDGFLINNKKNDIILVDFHAEATSEKNSLGYYLDGRVSAVLGTHTHVQTNDSRVLPKGTAYISDVGMVGSLHSSIGDDLEYSIHHFLTGLPFRISPDKEKPYIFNGVLITINEKNKKVELIEPIKTIVE